MSSTMKFYTLPHCSYCLLTIMNILLCFISVPTLISSSSLPPSNTIPQTQRTPQSSSLTGKDANDNHLNIAPQQHRKRRFIFQGPILTLTLKDPFADEANDQHKQEQPSPSQTTTGTGASGTGASAGTGAGNSRYDRQKVDSSSARKRHFFWSRNYNPSSYSNILNLNSLSPTLLYSVRSINRPFPYYLPWLQSTSITTGYKYDDVKNKPSFIEGEFKFRKRFFGKSGSSSNSIEGMALEVDIGPSYAVKEKKTSLVIRIGSDNGGVDGIDDEASGFGCFGLVRFVKTKGQKFLIDHFRGSYKMRLPFTAVGSISITPSYDFQKDIPACNIIGKSASGRTAAVLNLNWDNPTLSVVHALDQRNTISPEISLYDAKILYNWSVALDSGAIKTRVDPCSAIQVTWIDQSLNGKWVTDFKLPLVGNHPGPLAGDIRVRRQFVF